MHGKTVMQLPISTDTHMTVSDLPEVALQAPQLAQRQVDVWKLLAELLIQFLLQVTWTDVVNH